MWVIELPLNPSPPDIADHLALTSTLHQNTDVDPLIRQRVMGHKPTLNGVLGMTANYTHARPETRNEQVERAFRRWPESLVLAAERATGWRAG